MAIDNAKIKALLEQRQKLREGLAELRKDIDALDASAISVITDAGQNQQTAPALADGENNAASSTAAVDKPAEPSGQTETSAGQRDAVEKASASNALKTDMPGAMTEPGSPIQVKPAHAGEHPSLSAGSSTAKANVKTREQAEDQKLLEYARLLAAYFIEHPAPVNNTDLIALDMALGHYDQATTAADRKKARVGVKDHYRIVASASFAVLGINGQTLADSVKGSWLIWAVPLLIAALVLAALPVGALVVTLTDEMLQPDFAREVRWMLGIFLAFFWGFVGALALLAYRFSNDIAHGSFSARGGHSVGLWGGMGGLTGAVIYLLIEWLFDFSGVEAGFAIDIGAFVAGMFSRLLFEMLAKLVSLFTHAGKHKKNTLEHP